MARKLRVEYPGAIYHVLNRGNRREPSFRDHADRPHPRVRDRNPRRGVRQDWLAVSCLRPQAESFSSGGRDDPVPLCGIAGMKWFLGTCTGRFHAVASGWINRIYPATAGSRYEQIVRLKLLPRTAA